jgi:hypothetical protein
VKATRIGQITASAGDKRTCWRCGRTNKVNKARARAVTDYLCVSCKDVLALQERGTG